MPKNNASLDKKNTTPNTEAITNIPKKVKKFRLLQTSCPSMTLKEALSVPKAIKDNFAGQATAPLLVAEACGITPSSSNWRTLSGAAVAYGLTNGAYNSQEISLTPLGERIVAPIIEGDDIAAMREAALKPSILSEFYRQYDRNKLPKTKIAHNVLNKMGIPQERLDSAWAILRANATETNILRVISGNEYIYIDLDDNESTEEQSKGADSDISTGEVLPENVMTRMQITKPKIETENNPNIKAKPQVFISHGKNSATIVGQLKELLAYGQMEPIVSVEREKTAISVPDKVFDDMRNCDAGIIHVELEEIFSDTFGEGSYKHINENVLIEIGAAIALYGKRVIILCKKGTSLPSNLQGLYRCEYEGSQLDYSATMKLLKTMQELRNLM